MSVQEVEQPTHTTSDEVKPDHFFCCNEDISVCGMDISDLDFSDEWWGENDCIVCVDLLNSKHWKCPRCGLQGGY